MGRLNLTVSVDVNKFTVADLGKAISSFLHFENTFEDLGYKFSPWKRFSHLSRIINYNVIFCGVFLNH